jgi:hypothetical protein
MIPSTLDAAQRNIEVLIGRVGNDTKCEVRGSKDCVLETCISDYAIGLCNTSGRSLSIPCYDVAHTARTIVDSCTFVRDLPDGREEPMVKGQVVSGKDL